MFKPVLQVKKLIKESFISKSRDTPRRYVKDYNIIELLSVY